MKRLISLLMALVLIAAGTGYAYDDEIRFRTMDWGIDYQTIKQQIDVNDNCLTWDHYPATSVDEMCYGGETRLDELNVMFMVDYYEFDAVAGYEPSDVKMYFAHVPDENGRIDTSKSALFYGAEYTFTSKDSLAMYSDLQQKLISLYGPMDTEKDGKASFLKADKYYSIWEGANDTVLSLQLLKWWDDTSVELDDEIYIAYAWKKGDELLQQASDITVQNIKDDEAANYDNGNTDGL